MDASARRAAPPPSFGDCNSVRKLLQKKKLDGKVKTALQRMEIVQRRVEGSEADRSSCRFKFIAMRVWNGFSSLFFTANPHDIQNPLTVVFSNPEHSHVERIPPEELHASSVQHPEQPAWRWLLHSRRVPVEASTEPGAGTGSCGATRRAHEKPPCAGVGDADGLVWACRGCLTDLCAKKPNMPLGAGVPMLESGIRTKPAGPADALRRVLPRHQVPGREAGCTRACRCWRAASKRS